MACVIVTRDRHDGVLRVTRRNASVSPWGNRIIGTASVPASQLLANEKNFRIHPQPQQDVLAAVLNEIGFVQSVIVNKRTSKAWGRDRGVETVLDGHLRISLAISRSDDFEVPVSYVDLLPEEEAAIMASFDPIGAMATTDREKLDALVAELPDELRELTAILRADQKAIKKLVAFSAEDHHRVIVECGSIAQQTALIERLQAEGLNCRAE